MHLFSVSTLRRALTFASTKARILSTVQPSPVPEESSKLETRAVEWQARHRLTSAQYQTTFTELANQGYRLTDISGYTYNEEPRYAAIWEKTSGPEWVAHHCLTAAQYQEAFNTYLSQGFRLRLVNGYTVAGNQARFAAIWDKSTAPGPWVSRHGLTSAERQEAFKKYVRGQGYCLVHCSGYNEGGTAKYAAIWEKPAVKKREYCGYADGGMTDAQYQTTFLDRIGEGYNLARINGYVFNGTAYYVAIWDTTLTGPWAAYRNMTADQYQALLNRYTAHGGYRLKQISGYTLGGADDRYAAIFVKEGI